MSVQAGFIFDMDGVIIDSNPFHKISLKQFCAQHGYTLTEQQLIEKIYGRTNNEWIAAVFGNIGKERITQLGEEKEALFRDLYQHDIKPLDGLPDFLAQLDEHRYRRAIATSAPRSNVDFVLDKTGITSFFDIILDQADVTRGKPDPEIYQKAARAVDLDPGHCIVFEDSLSGIQAAKAAGCKVVGVTTTHTAAEMQLVDLVIDNFTGLDPKALISRLF